MSQLSWTCRFECDNCNHEWSTEIPKKHLVEINVVYDISGGERKFSRHVVCPICDTEKKVSKWIRKRT